MDTQPNPVEIVAVRLACTACLEERRIDVGLVDNLNAAASAWINAHNAPEVVCIETEHDGVIDEWMPA